MYHFYWNDWYSGWGWNLWFGFVFLFFSSIWDWGYGYRTNMKYATLPSNEALNILNERYARGEINRKEYSNLKSDF